MLADASSAAAAPAREYGLASGAWDAYLEQAHRRLRALLVNPSRTAFIDGNPLPVSDDSRDPDARNGWAMQRFRRGHELHAPGATGWGGGVAGSAAKQWPRQ